MPVKSGDFPLCEDDGMRRKRIFEEVQEIIRTHLEDDSIRITEATVADDVPDWDSVAHVRIVVAIENRFGILFDPLEYTDFADVGELVGLIQRKLALKGPRSTPSPQQLTTDE
jgi:acyl carrier protein